MINIKEVKKTALYKIRSKTFYFTILSLIKEGKNPSDMSLSLNLSKQRLNYYIKRLKIEGIINKIGYGTWEINKEKYKEFLEQKEVKKQPKERSFSLFKKDIRGHGFQVSLDLPKISRWTNEQRQRFLKENSLPYKNIGLHYTTQSLELKENKIWLSNKRITIYWSKFKNYYGESAKESRKLFFYDLLYFIKYIENFFNINLRMNKGYKFKICKQHFGKIKDDLAKQYNKEGRRLYVDNIHGYWVIVDDSLHLDEIETIHKDTAVADMDEVIKPFLNQLKDTKLMPNDILNTFNKISEIQKKEIEKWGFYADNIKTHTEAIIKLSKSIDILNSKLKQKQLFQSRLKW